MVRREQLFNKLRQLGYVYKRETDKVQLWKKKGGQHYAAIRHGQTLDDDYVRSVLHQCGCNPPDVETFIGSCKS